LLGFSQRMTRASTCYLYEDGMVHFENAPCQDGESDSLWFEKDYTRFFGKDAIPCEKQRAEILGKLYADKIQSIPDKGKGKGPMRPYDAKAMLDGKMAALRSELNDSFQIKSLRSKLENGSFVGIADAVELRPSYKIKCNMPNSVREVEFSANGVLADKFYKTQLRSIFGNRRFETDLCYVSIGDINTKKLNDAMHSSKAYSLMRITWSTVLRSSHNDVVTIDSIKVFNEPEPITKLPTMDCNNCAVDAYIKLDQNVIDPKPPE